MDPIIIELQAVTDLAVSQVKAGINKISSFVTDLQKNKVDWTDLLTGLLDPAAIVGEIGALFTASIASVADFQAAAQGAMADSSSAFADGANGMTGSAISISSKTGTAAGDVMTALGGLAKSWTDVNMITAIATDASELAAAGLGKASDIAQSFSDVLKAFGITDVPTAKKAMEVLYTAARNSSLSFSDFTKTMTVNASSMKANNITLQEAANTLSVFSTQSGLTGEQATSAFNQISKAISGTDIESRVIIESFKGVLPALKSGDLLGAIGAVEAGFRNGGIAAQQLGLKAGISGATIVQLGTTTVDSFKEIQKQMEILTGLEEKLGEKLNAPTTATTELAKEWQKLSTAFLQTFGWVGSVGIGFLKTALEMLTETVQQFGSLEKGIHNVGNSFGDWLSDVTGLTQQMKDLTKEGAGVTDSMNVHQLLGKSGLNFSGSQISQIQQQGTSTNSMHDLLLALQGNDRSANNISSTLNLGNLNITAGENSKDIANAVMNALYKQFQGTK